MIKCFFITDNITIHGSTADVSMFDCNACSSRALISAPRCITRHIASRPAVPLRPVSRDAISAGIPRYVTAKWGKQH